MKHIKSFLSLTLLSVLLLSGCTDSNSVTPTPPPQPTPVVGNDGIINFNTKVEFSYYRLSDVSRDDDIEMPNNAYEKKDNIIWYSPIDFTVTASKMLFAGDVDEENVTAIADWLVAVYSTAVYSDEEQMKKNIESRYGVLSDSLVDYVKQHTPEIIKNFMPKHATQELGFANGENYFFSYGELVKLKGSDSKEYRGIVFDCSLILKGKDYKSLMTDYIASSGYGLRNFAYLDSETASANIYYPRLIIVLDDNGKLAAWGELFGRLVSSPPTRYLVAAKSGISRGEEILPLPLTVDPSFKNTNLSYMNDKAKSAQKLGITCYKDFLGLSSSSSESYFDSFLNNCSDSLNSVLKSSNLLKEMLANAKKYNVKITLDPKSESVIEKELSVMDYYCNTDYGDVYIFERNCYIKTGSEDFNKKYGLPKDKRIANFKFCIADENGTSKLVGFAISADMTYDERYNTNLNEVWQGNWDNG